MQLPRRDGATLSRPARVANARDRQLGALTAAAVPVNRRNGTMMRRLVQPWQQAALAYYDRIGECWNAAQFYSRSLKRVRIYAAERDESGELVETENEDAVAEVARIQDPGGGGYSRLFDAYGRLKFLIAEGYFLVTDPTGEQEQWEFVSPDELRINGSGEYTRFAAPSLPAELLTDVPDSAYKPVGDEAMVYRVWRPHPRYSALADSPMRAQLEILNELELLTLAVAARAKNRMNSDGILFLPDSLTASPLEAVGDEDPANDPLMTQLIEQYVAPITDPGSAAAASPAMMRGPDDSGEKIRWIQTSNPLETYPEEGLRTELIRRFATGIEMPAELLMGTADVNHWGAWLIDEQAAKNYIFPLCQELCDDLTSVFLRPVLKQGNVPDWDRYVVAYDASAIVAHPDRTKDFKDAYDRIEISGKAYRDAIDANDTDAPSEEEWQRRAALQLKDLSALADPYDPGTTDPVNEDEQQTGEEGGPQTGGEAQADLPDTNPSEANGDGTAQLSNRVLGACAVGMARARELAGARLRTILSRADAETLSSITSPAELDQVPNGMLAATLGIGWVRQHAGRGELQLVKGATTSLVSTLRGFGVSEKDAAALADMVTTHAAVTLFKPTVAELPKAIHAYIAGTVR